MKQIPRRKVLQWGLGAGAVGALAACAPPTPQPDPTTTTPPAPSWPTTTSTTTTSTTTTTTTTTLPPAPIREPGAGRDRHGRRARRQLHGDPVRGRRVLLPPADGVGAGRSGAPAEQPVRAPSEPGAVHRRPVAVVEGLGHPNPDFSHSEMLRRWWFGDTDGRQFPRYGFLGRLCDAIGTPDDAATGVSLGWGPSASLASASAVTLSMDPYGDGSFPGYPDPGMHAAWIAAHRAMSQEDRAEATMLFAGRTGIRTALRFSDLLTAIPDSTIAYPDTTLGAQLAAAVRLIRADAGIRIVHVPFSGDFDTHEDHRSRHDNLMTELDGALDSFLQELGSLGMTQNVLLATTSEFGRRANQNDNGLDHGTATVGMLAGAIHPGVFGAHPNWAALDTNDNLRCTVTMGDYYATLAQWMGVHPGDVLAGTVTPLAGVTA